MSFAALCKLLVLAGALGVGLIAGRWMLPIRAATPAWLISEQVEAPANVVAEGDNASAHQLRRRSTAGESVRAGRDHDALRYPVTVSVPEGPPRVTTDRMDHLGRPVTVSCASCHSNLAPNPARRSSESPPLSFHQGLVYRHGDMTCLSCHNPQDYNALRLADGAVIPYAEVMSLCAQCHAPQARDWAHGAHGGMTGYWDLTRGPRHRKSCIDCHDPHAPVFPSMTPTFKPRDRFLHPRQAHTGDGHD